MERYILLHGCILHIFDMICCSRAKIAGHYLPFRRFPSSPAFARLFLLQQQLEHPRFGFPFSDCSLSTPRPLLFLRSYFSHYPRRPYYSPTSSPRQPLPRAHQALHTRARARKALTRGTGPRIRGIGEAGQGED